MQAIIGFLRHHLLYDRAQFGRQIRANLSRIVGGLKETRDLLSDPVDQGQDHPRYADRTPNL